jgi:hypothetical protein
MWVSQRGARKKCLRLLGEFRIDVDVPVLEYLRAEQRTPLLPAVVVG